MTPPGYVIIWREAPSTRLRTYVDPATERPYSYLPGELVPPPSPTLTTQRELEEFLASPPDESAVAVPAQLARDYLGWDPVPYDPSAP